MAAGKPLVSGLFLIQLEGPLSAEHRETLQSKRLRLLSPVPDDSFVCHLDAASTAEIRAIPFVRWLGEYQPEWRMDQRLTAAMAAEPQVPRNIRLLLRPQTPPAALISALRQFSGPVHRTETAFGIFLLRQSFAGVPVELEEAARIDGCTPLGEWWNVMIPAARADLITLAMFVFIGTWSDFLWPLVILDDPQSLEWSDEEREELAADASTRWLTEPMPAGIHLRPEGYGASRTVLMLWDYHSAHRFSAPEFPMPDDALYPELVLRGMTSLAPGLATYLERLPHAYVDGGYYTKTAENRPLVGPSGVGGAFVCAGFSGFGLMAAPACGELLAAQIVGAARPAYERAFLPTRYDDPAYVAQLANWGSTGQL